MMQTFCSEPARDRRNQRRILGWSLGWALTFLAAVFVIKKTAWLADGSWPPEGLWAAFAAMVPTALGIAAALAYRRFLRETDELRRKIELEALALAYSVGVVGGLTYWLLEVAGFVGKADVAFLVVLMLLAHPLGVVIGRRRYA